MTCGICFLMIEYIASFIQKNNRCRKRISERNFRMGKRETGEKPVRSRHCDKGVQPSGAGKLLGHWYILCREGDGGVRIFQSGNLPVIGTGRRSGSRGIGRTEVAPFCIILCGMVILDVLRGIFLPHFLCNRKLRQCKLQMITIVKTVEINAEK